MRQLIIFFLGAFILVGCASQATFGDAITEGEPTPIPTPIVPNKPVYQVERGDIIYERRFFGRISPVITRNIEFSIDGRIAETLATVGDIVAVGDVLAKLDTSDLENQLLDAEEQLAVAQSIFDSANNQVIFSVQRAQLNLDLAQLGLDHAVAQAETPPTSDDQFTINTRTIERDLAQLALDELQDGIDPELRFDVTRAQNQVDDITSKIDQSELIATMDGQLTSFPIATGENVTAFNTVGVISDLSEFELTDDLDASDLSELSEGIPVTIQQATGPSETYTGVITALPQPFGTGIDDFIHITFDEVDDSLEVGDRMSFIVTIDTREGVLVLPKSAIRQFSGREFVVVQNESVQQRVDVKLGLEGDNQVEILEGLEENQTVIGP